MIKIKLLYLTQYLSSGKSPGIIRHYQHARLLSKMGFDVEVLASDKSYMGNKSILEDFHNEDFTTSFVKVKNYSGKSVMKRLIHYFSYFFKALIRTFKSGKKYDIILATSPSLFVGLLGYFVSKLKKSKYVLEVRDLWPETAIALGLIKNPIIINTALLLEKFLYNKADKIICLTQGIKNHIDDITRTDKTILITNGIDSFEIESLKIESLDKHKDDFVCMYIGAHGYNNSLNILLESARLTSHNDKIVYILVGDGGYKEELKYKVEELNLKNIVFFDSIPKDLVQTYLSYADIVLWPVLETPINPKFKEGVLPNKVFDYLASNKPILTTFPYSEGAKIITEINCGIVTSENSGDKMAESLEYLFLNRERLKEMEGKGLNYVKENYSREILVTRLAKELKRSYEGENEIIY